MKKLIESKIAIEIVLYLNKNKGKENIAANISYDLRRTYSGIVNILKFLEENGYVTSKREGRKVLISLTKKGIDAALNIIELNSM